jgi:hypothetical protein
VDCTITNVDRDGLGRSMEHYPPAFVQEIAMAALRKVDITHWDTSMGDGSTYLEPEEAKDNTT